MNGFRQRFFWLTRRLWLAIQAAGAVFTGGFHSVECGARDEALKPSRALPFGGKMSIPRDRFLIAELRKRREERARIGICLTGCGLVVYMITMSVILHLK